MRVIDRSAAVDAPKSGDVVTVQADGWPWSLEELTHDRWRIVRVPILQTTADALMSGPSNPLISRARKTWTVDLSLLPGPTRFVGQRLDTIITMTRTEATTAIRQKVF